LHFVSGDGDGANRTTLLQSTDSRSKISFRLNQRTYPGTSLVVTSRSRPAIDHRQSAALANKLVPYEDNISDDESLDTSGKEATLPTESAQDCGMDEKGNADVALPNGNSCVDSTADTSNTTADIRNTVEPLQQLKPAEDPVVTSVPSTPACIGGERLQFAVGIGERVVSNNVHTASTLSSKPSVSDPVSAVVTDEMGSQRDGKENMPTTENVQDSVDAKTNDDGELWGLVKERDMACDSLVDGATLISATKAVVASQREAGKKAIQTTENSRDKTDEKINPDSDSRGKGEEAGDCLVDGATFPSTKALITSPCKPADAATVCSAKTCDEKTNADSELREPGKESQGMAGDYLANGATKVPSTKAAMSSTSDAKPPNGADSNTSAINPHGSAEGRKRRRHRHKSSSHHRRGKRRRRHHSNDSGDEDTELVWVVKTVETVTQHRNGKYQHLHSVSC